KDNLASVQSNFESPGTLLLNVEDQTGKVKGFGGAVASPEKISSAAPPPDDFDDFWRAKLAESHAIPLNAKLEQAESKRAGVSYWKIALDNIRAAHSHGQLARPET